MSSVAKDFNACVHEMDGIVAGTPVGLKAIKTRCRQTGDPVQLHLRSADFLQQQLNKVEMAQQRLVAPNVFRAPPEMASRMRNRIAEVRLEIQRLGLEN